MAHIVRTAAGRRCYSQAGKILKNSRCGLGLAGVSAAMDGLGYAETRMLITKRGGKKGKGSKFRHLNRRGKKVRTLRLKLAGGRILYIKLGPRNCKCGSSVSVKRGKKAVRKAARKSVKGCKAKSAKKKIGCCSHKCAPKKVGGKRARKSCMSACMKKKGVRKAASKRTTGGKRAKSAKPRKRSTMLSRCSKACRGLKGDTFKSCRSQCVKSKTGRGFSTSKSAYGPVRETRR